MSMPHTGENTGFTEWGEFDRASRMRCILLDSPWQVKPRPNTAWVSAKYLE